MLGRVIGSTRTYPIRVGGTSGPGYEDQREISWDTLKQPEERTTVTNKVRRVFTFSWDQIAEAIWINQPNDLFLNFCNYMANDAVEKLVHNLNSVMALHGPNGAKVHYLGWGPNVDNIEEIG